MPKSKVDFSVEVEFGNFQVWRLDKLVCFVFLLWKMLYFYIDFLLCNIFPHEKDQLIWVAKLKNHQTVLLLIFQGFVFQLA